ncbi:MAG TPA: ABC transporter permease [Candidatus Limnocylindrales bacterium]|nr:ABC transporter permease [Candidatus Limnocylindrales bacterium]
MSRITALLRRGLVPLLAVITALLFGAIVIILTDFNNLANIGSDPAGALGGALSGVLNGYGAMLTGALGDPQKIGIALETMAPADIATAIRPLTETLVSATPLIFAGLGVAISFRAGMFNIGGDGQILVGALGATLTAFLLNGQAPAFVILAAALVVGTLFGAGYGFIPGFLKARTGAHEVITTIMLNYVAAQIVFFALRGPILRQPGSTAPVSKNMSAFVDVPLLINLPAIRLDLSFIAALLVAVLISWLLFRTTIGFELRASGFNMTAARYAGMSAGGSMMLAMALSGALMGLGGSFLVVGTVGQLSNDLAGGIGFNAIALALLAGLRPSGVVAAALLFGALSNGGKVMGIQSGIPFDLLSFIFALVIMFVAAPGLIRTIWRIKVSRPQPELAISQQPVASE